MTIHLTQKIQVFGGPSFRSRPLAIFLNFMKYEEIVTEIAERPSVTLNGHRLVADGDFLLFIESTKHLPFPDDQLNGRKGRWHEIGI